LASAAVRREQRRRVLRRMGRMRREVTGAPSLFQRRSQRERQRSSQGGSSWGAGRLRQPRGCGGHSGLLSRARSFQPALAAARRRSRMGPAQPLPLQRKQQRRWRTTKQMMAVSMQQGLAAALLEASGAVARRRAGGCSRGGQRRLKRALFARC
jgi:hypothetical protein